MTQVSSAIPSEASRVPEAAANPTSVIVQQPCFDMENLRLPIQRAPLTVGAVDDPLEKEADDMADRVMRKADVGFIQRKCARCEEEEPIHRKSMAPLAQRMAEGSPMAVPERTKSKIQDTRGGGNHLPTPAKSFMEAGFQRDFSHVKVHTGDYAVQLSKELNAQAFTVGSDIYFNQGKFQPESKEGQHLLAHELTHTVQQQTGLAKKVQRYTEAERREMAERRVVGQASDIALANQRGFQPGDIVFRLGSRALGFLMNQPVTHGGIYIGNGLIHDVVAFGNRNIRVSNFYSTPLGEAADPSIFRVVRFVGPLSSLILQRLLANINAGNFRMPTDPVPFNLFSTADDYRTATCLEYAHAQFLHAIRELSIDPNVPEADRNTLRSTYFRAGSSQPSNLINPVEQRLIGNTPSMAPTFSSSPYGQPPPRTISALMQSSALIAAATHSATDLDPNRFQNRDESQYRQVYPQATGWRWLVANLITGGQPLYDEVVLRTFTYQSFVDSRSFFSDVTPPPPSVTP